MYLANFYFCILHVLNAAIYPAMFDVNSPPHSSIVRLCQIFSLHVPSNLGYDRKTCIAVPTHSSILKLYRDKSETMRIYMLDLNFMRRPAITLMDLETISLTSLLRTLLV